MTTFYPFRSRRRFASGGVNQDQTWWVKCEGVGKQRSADNPYLFANEWIAGCIAQFLRLPIPPFTLMSKCSKRTAMFCSYSFQGDSTPSDVDPVTLIKLHPFICAGITVFDIFVANPDRHGGNLKVDNKAKPKDFFIFDHERALFYIYANEGIQRLNDRANRLGITDGADSADEWHCLMEHLESLADIAEWVRRVESIPDWFIEATCEEVWKHGITRAETNAVIAFLKDRQSRISTLISENKGRFIGIPKGWGLFV